MTPRLPAAVVQINSGTDKAANLESALRQIRAAARAGARLIALPEYWTYLGPEEGYAAAAEDIAGPTVSQLVETVRELDIHLLAGTMLEAIPGDTHFYNTSLLIDPTGNVIARYRKIHLFDIDVTGAVSALESASIAPGTEIVSAVVADHILGLSVCYDLRFPELYRALADRGAEMLAVPAAFTMFTGKDHWELLLRARAVENQSFVLAPGQFGKYPGGWSYGRSMIVDPWGTILAMVPDGEGFAIADLNFERLAEIRRELPALANRRIGRTGAPE